jgi:arylsulfatase A-like enzyme
VTGRYPHNNGKASELHLPIAGHLAWFPSLLREAGYYTALVGKHHMSVDSGKDKHKPFDLVDGGRGPGNRGGHATWVKTVEERPQDKPFFFWFAAYDAHRGWDSDKDWDAKYGEMHDPKNVVVPPFLVDNAETRRDLASYYNEVTRYDYYIGQVVDKLRAEGELDNTLIFVLADNGRPFPRAKTRLHDSGMKTALVAHWPAGIKGKEVKCDSLVSVIDLAPTILAAANVEKAKSMQGVDLSPLFAKPTSIVRNFAFSEHNWHDYEAHGRSVRSNEYLYIRNHRKQQMWQGPADSVRSPSHVSLLKRKASGKLSAAQADVFLAPRQAEELYLKSDFNQLNNLAGDSKHATEKARLAKLMDQWMDETGDSVPDDISKDSFHRETGKALKGLKYRGTSPGEDRGATKINKPGPR